ncbi:piggyBac transposable element-derived protein 3-like [Anthonomus grandis grandis]|uniref:piggyBac transposable element-derived protein 3-like n=1 Tax=Anthonomus grandis grandis TaxID=2921223 RepID=UPI0021661550|nr:piggyBac transposable element-derived protein 3-like [Anthonomus grandis grandis]
MASSSRALSEDALRNILESEDLWESIEDSNQMGSSKKSVSVGVPNREAVLEELERLSEESDENEEDSEILSDHNSETEQEDSDSDEKELPIRKSWYGKDNTKWSKTAGIRGRTPAHNLVTILPGLIGPARNNPPREPVYAWSLLIPNEMIQKLVDFTNLKITSTRENCKKSKRFAQSQTKFWPSFTENTNICEIKTFFGLLNLQSIFKSNHEDVRSIWATDGTGRPIFRATMSLARFSFLLSCLRFDNVETRKERVKTDKLTAVSELFDEFVARSKSCYSPGIYLTVDEMFVPFRGKCGFRMNIPNKPAKYGIKVHVLADAKTHYLVDAKIYAGSEIKVDGAKKPTLSNPTRVVLRLVECVKGTNRNITGDNWYSSVELVDELKKNSLTYVGILRKNKKSVPPEFLPNRFHSSTFEFTSSTTIVSYMPKKSKTVILLSSMHHDNSVNETTKKRS